MTREQAQQLDKIAKRKNKRVVLHITQDKVPVANFGGLLSPTADNLGWVVQSNAYYAVVWATDKVDITTEKDNTTVTVKLSGRRVTHNEIIKHAALIDERRQQNTTTTKEPTQ